MHKKQLLHILDQTTQEPNYITKVSIQNIAGEQLQELTDDRTTIFFYEYNPQREFASGQIYVYTDQYDQQNGNFYIKTLEDGDMNNDPNAPSEYHTKTFHDLRECPLKTKYLNISFSPLNYEITITPEANTFYHVVFTGLYSGTGQTFTNMNVNTGVGGLSLLDLFRKYFWHQNIKRVTMMEKCFSQRNLMLTMYLNQLYPPTNLDQPPLRVISKTQVVPENTQSILYEPFDMNQNQFANLKDLKMFRFNSNSINILKYFPSNALPQSKDLIIFVNTDLQRIIMQAKYKKATVIVDEEQVDLGGQDLNTIVKKNRKQMYRLSYSQATLVENGTSVSLSTQSGNPACVVVTDKYTKLTGAWTTGDIKNLILWANLTDIESMALPNIQTLNIFNKNGSFNLKADNFIGCTNLRQIKFHCPLNVVGAPLDVFRNCHADLQVYVKNQVDAGKMETILINSGYTTPIVKILNKFTIEMQYTSTIRQAEGVEGLFIQQGQVTVSLANLGFSDIIVNDTSFALNTDTLLGNPIKSIYVRVDTGTPRTFQANCFNNATLKNVFFMSPTTSGTFYYPTLSTIFTEAQKGNPNFIVYCMNSSQAQTMQTQPLPMLTSDAKRYAAIQWFDNAVNLSEILNSLSYSVRAYVSITNSWIIPPTASDFSYMSLTPGTNAILGFSKPTLTSPPETISANVGQQHLSTITFNNKLVRIASINLLSDAGQGVQFLNIPGTLTLIDDYNNAGGDRYINGIANAEQLGIIWVSGANTPLRPSNFKDGIYNGIIIPDSQACAEKLLANGWSASKLLWGDQMPPVSYVPPAMPFKQITFWTIDDEPLTKNIILVQMPFVGRPNNLTYHSVPEPIFQNPQFVQNDQQTQQLTNPNKLVKYSEFPLMFIFEIYINNSHVETILSKGLYLQKLNKYKWLWSSLEKRTQSVKVTIKQKYYDGTRIIDIDEFDVGKQELYMRLLVQ